MIEGGKRLGRIKSALREKIKVGKNAAEVDKKADELIKEAGGKPSFKGVPGYSWATCINKNEGMVHGIPSKNIVFENGDVISVDIGMLFQGYHLDTSFSVGLNPDVHQARFLNTGREALKAAIEKTKEGFRVYDISEAIESVVVKAGYTPIKDLVGHGIGKKLHEDPPIPCFKQGSRESSPIIPKGATLAIEVMYTQGRKDLIIESDGWTISTADGKISALFEETVAVTGTGPLILTEG